MINKLTILLLAFSTSLFAQDEVKEEKKEPIKTEVIEKVPEGPVIELKEKKAEPIKGEIKDNTPAKSQEAEPAKREIKETKIFYDPEEKKQIKILTSYYEKDNKEIAHGPSRLYHQNGQIAQEMNYADGFKNGFETLYSDSGLKEHQFLWKNGELVKEIVYFVDGVIKAETELKSIDDPIQMPGKPQSKIQIRHGTENIYYKNGRIQTQNHWSDDKQNGLETKWFDNGKKKYELTWKMGKKDGIETHWYITGQVSDITNWIDNQAHGEMVTYHKNGVKKDQLEWDHGVLVNERSTWNDKGVLIAKCVNKNGNTFNGTVYDPEYSLILTFENGNQISSKVCDKDGKIKEK